MGKTSSKAVQKYKQKSYDRVETLFPKGYKEVLETHVQYTGETIGAFIKRAVSETIERDEQTAGFLHKPDTSDND